MSDHNVQVGQWRLSQDKSFIAFISSKGETLYQVVCYARGKHTGSQWLAPESIERLYPTVVDCDQIAAHLSPHRAADEKKVTCSGDLWGILGLVSFAPSGVVDVDRLDIRWDVQAIDNDGLRLEGWLVRLTFTRPDTETGETGRGAGRWEYVAVNTTESGVVKTCWLLWELLVRHELMEGFQFKGVRVFSPHKTVAELAWFDRAESAAKGFEKGEGK